MPTTPPPQDTTRPRAFVLRIWRDAGDRLWGQIAEPLHDWRQPFSSVDDLARTLAVRMADPSPGLDGELAEEE